MNINDYQDWTETVWLKGTDSDQDITHCLFGLQTETAELTDIHKKDRYTPNRATFQDYDAHIVEELGDILFYLVRYADEQGISMDEVIDVNVNKLNKRYPQ